jgi:hypothetical protein
MGSCSSSIRGIGTRSRCGSPFDALIQRAEMGVRPVARATAQGSHRRVEVDPSARAALLDSACRAARKDNTER